MTSASRGANNVPPWLKIAETQIGVNESESSSSADRIESYYQAVSVTPEEEPPGERGWCAIFVAWALQRAGHNPCDTVLALDWMDWGAPLADWRKGAVAIFERESPDDEGGHIGFCVGRRGDEVEVLGGNQSDQVISKWYPIDGYLGDTHFRLVGYRWPE